MTFDHTSLHRTPQYQSALLCVTHSAQGFGTPALWPHLDSPERVLKEAGRGHTAGRTASPRHQASLTNRCASNRTIMSPGTSGPKERCTGTSDLQDNHATTEQFQMHSVL